MSSVPTLVNTRDLGYVSIPPKFEPKDFGSWKERMLLHIVGVEPYLMTILNEGPYIPTYVQRTPGATPDAPEIVTDLVKPEVQWTEEERKLKPLAQNIRASAESRRHAGSSSATSSSANPLSDPLALISSEPIYPNDGASTSSLPASFQALVEELDAEEKQEMFSDFVEFALIAGKKKGHYQKECKVSIPTPAAPKSNSSKTADVSSKPKWLKLKKPKHQAKAVIGGDFESTACIADMFKDDVRPEISIPPSGITSHEEMKKWYFVKGNDYHTEMDAGSSTSLSSDPSNSSEAKSIAPQPLTLNKSETFKRSNVAAPYDYSTPQRADHTKQQPQSISSNSFPSKISSADVSQHERLMERRVRFGDIRIHNEGSSQAKPVVHQRASHHSPPRSILRHPTPLRSKVSQSVNRPTTPQRGNIPPQQMRSTTPQQGHTSRQRLRSVTPQRGNASQHQSRSVTPQRGHLPHQQVRSSTPNKRQLSSQQSQSSIPRVKYLPHRQGRSSTPNQSSRSTTPNKVPQSSTSSSQTDLKQAWSVLRGSQMASSSTPRLDDPTGKSLLGPPPLSKNSRKQKSKPKPKAKTKASTSSDPKIVELAQQNDLSSQLKEFLLSNQQSNSSNRKCYIYGMRGHIATDCCNSRDAPEVVVQSNAHTLAYDSLINHASSTMISESPPNESLFIDTGSMGTHQSNLANYIASQRIEIPHSQNVISNLWGRPAMLVEFSAPNVISNSVVLQENENNMMTTDENDRIHGLPDLGNHFSLEETFSAESSSTTDAPIITSTDIPVSESENGPN
uniref:probable serine/threonine-protein kinase nek3 n=1 Tax=Erigeron canadensis TaxID=72917 RepID=UPI001CB989E8|nr:probable serine/threonine-protein kinase nek3 [Erigeron canadensis]